MFSLQGMFDIVAYFDAIFCTIFRNGEESFNQVNWSDNFGLMRQILLMIMFSFFEMAEKHRLGQLFSWLCSGSCDERRRSLKQGLRCRRPRVRDSGNSLNR